MILKLQSHLLQNFSFLKEKKLLLAVSGGLDSMVMLYLFKKLDYNIAITHCNFMLRDKESDEDQKFIERYAQDNNTLLFVTRFDTALFAKDQNISIQMAARTLRYTWFHQLLKEQHFDYILTAHHADDVIETFLINLIRGTGLEGLTGIPKQNGKIIRPFLPFNRAEFEQYAKEEQLLWREDSSNASDKYIRNKLRHHVVPVIKSLNVNFSASFQQTLSHLQQARTMAEDAAVLAYQQVTKQEGEQIRFDLAKIKLLSDPAAYLYSMLKTYGFTSSKDIAHIIDSQSGKQIFSNTYRLLKDRTDLILEKRKQYNTNIYTIAENTTIDFPIGIAIKEVDHIIKAEDHSIVFVDKEKLKFPLFLRKWKKGDYFYPFGMKGQKKKLSKYFKAEKLSLIDKENSWLLCSEDQIVWIVGKRIDERFKVTASTKLISQIKLY